MRFRWSFRPGSRALVAGLALAGCQPGVAPPVPAPEPSPVNGIGYVVFSAPIDRGSSALLIQDLDRLQAGGAREIDLGINSPGGQVEAAESIVAEMNRLHAEDGVTFSAFDLGLVASAAALVFLDAQNRYAAPRSGFILHAPYAMAVGTFSAEALRKEADQIDRAAQLFRDVLLARTHLNRQQVEVYVTRTVLLSADDAQHDGVIDAVRPLAPPREARAWLIKAKPRPPGQRKPAAAP